MMFTLQIDPALQRVVAAADPLNELVQKAVVDGSSELMESLGIPGHPVIGITALQHERTVVRLMRVRAEERVLRYSDETVRSLYCSLNNTITRTDIAPAEILSWLVKMSGPEASDSDHHVVANFSPG